VSREVLAADVYLRVNGDAAPAAPLTLLHRGPTIPVPMSRMLRSSLAILESAVAPSARKVTA